MNTERKLELAVSIINSVNTNSQASFDARLKEVPHYLDIIYKKIDELSKPSAKTVDKSTGGEKIDVI